MSPTPYFQGLNTTEACFLLALQSKAGDPWPMTISHALSQGFTFPWGLVVTCIQLVGRGRKCRAVLLASSVAACAWVGVTHITSALIPLRRTRDMDISRCKECWEGSSWLGSCILATSLYNARGSTEFCGQLYLSYWDDVIDMSKTQRSYIEIAHYFIAAPEMWWCLCRNKML